MILLLQLLAVLVPAALAALFSLLVIGPAIGGIIHGRHFTLNPWHAVLAGLLSAVALALAVAFGWVSFA